MNQELERRNGGSRENLDLLPKTNRSQNTMSHLSIPEREREKEDKKSKNRNQSSATECIYIEGGDGARGESEGNGKKHHASASPLRSARSARTSVTYCNASSMGMRWRRSLSVGSFIQPSIGIALSRSRKLERYTRLRRCCLMRCSKLTFVENVTHGTIVKYHHFA